ncbi:hypothetical protein ACFLWR_04720 [Chloroflexota bacterium]
MRRPGMAFSFAGVVFLIVAIVTGNYAAFLTIGLALVVVGMLIQRRGQKSQ